MEGYYELPEAAIPRVFRSFEHRLLGALIDVGCYPMGMSLGDSPRAGDLHGLTFTMIIALDLAAAVDGGFLVLQTEHWSVVFERYVYGHAAFEDPVAGWIVGDVDQFENVMTLLRVFIPLNHD